MATSIPACLKSLIPWPSRTSKALISLPSSSMMILPSVITPSTSRTKSLTLAALMRSFSLICPAISDYTGLEQVVQVEDPPGRFLAGLVKDEEGGDGVFLHLLNGLGSQGVGLDPLGVVRHALPRSPLQEVG